MPQTRRALGLALAGSMLATLTVAGPAAAATSPTFSVDYSSSCVVVSGPASGVGTFRHLASDNSLLEERAVGLNNAGNGAGNAVLCLEDAPVPGQTLWANVEGVTRTLTLPRVSLRIDRSTDVLRGTAPAGTTVKLTVFHYAKLGVGATTVTRTRTASATGAWSTDLTAAVNIVGGDQAAATHTTSAGDKVTAREISPVLRIWIGRSTFAAGLQTGTGGTVTLRAPSGAVRGSGVVSAVSGQLAEQFGTFTANGLAAVPRVGDRVSAPFQPSMAFTIPTLTLTVSKATDVVSGACVAGRSMQVRIVYPGDESSAFFRCPADRTYSVNWSGIIDIIPGYTVEVVTRLPSGDVVQRRQIVS
jgi:hypothetical protein